MKYQVIEKTVSLSTAYSDATESFNITGQQSCDSFAVMCINDVDTPSAKTFTAASVDTVTDQITITAHTFSTGLKGQVSNPGALPTGLSASTDYFVIVIDADTIQLATSLVNALAATAINITAQGSGTNTFTPTAIAGASIKLQQSMDNLNWADLGSATNITADGNVYLSAVDPTSKYIRAYLTITAGHITSSLQFLGKGDRDV